MSSFAPAPSQGQQCREAGLRMSLGQRALLPERHILPLDGDARRVADEVVFAAKVRPGKINRARVFPAVEGFKFVAQ